MARRNNNSQATENKPFATAKISGVVHSAYCDGKKYDYVTIKVDHSYDEYYDLYKVAVSKKYDIPDDGEPIEVKCFMKSYKGEISFKEVSADTQ